jgi:hypothetical protein
MNKLNEQTRFELGFMLGVLMAQNRVVEFLHDCELNCRDLDRRSDYANTSGHIARFNDSELLDRWYKLHPELKKAYLRNVIELLRKYND